MYKKIIVCLALDHGISQKALTAARSLLSEGGEILAVHVYEAPNSSVQAFLDEDMVASAFAAAKTRLAERVSGVQGVESVMLKGHSGRAITDYATDIGADCIIVGSHKPGLGDFLLGSTAARVVRHAPCAVLVLR